MNDSKLEDYGFKVTYQKKTTKPKGWASIKSSNKTIKGTIKLEWDSKTSILLCRIINKGKGKPDYILGNLIQYLFSQYKKYIIMINIIPQK
jgi:hypothetical protein